MNSALPVMSPLRFYDRRGFVARAARDERRKRLRSQHVRRRTVRRQHRPVSRDFTHHPPRQFRTVLLAAIAATLLAPAAAAANDHAPRVLFILSAREAVGASLLAGFLAGLAAGVALGLSIAAGILRAADTVAMQYHRSEVAAMLDAANETHALVFDIVERSHARLADLRGLLARLKETA